MSADSLATDHQVRREYPLLTSGLDKEMDVLGVCVQALNELSDLQRVSVIDYLMGRFGYSRRP